MKEISVISGGTSGLGLEIADLLVKSGKNVLILGRSNDKLAEASSRLKKVTKNILVESLTCNIGNEDDINQVGDYLTKNKFSG